MSYTTAPNLGAPVARASASPASAPVPTPGWTTTYPWDTSGLVLTPDFRQVPVTDVLAAAGVSFDTSGIDGQVATLEEQVSILQGQITDLETRVATLEGS